MINIEIDQKQLQEIIKKADPSRVKEPLAGLIKEASGLGYAVATHNLKGGLQIARITMRTKVQPMEAKVFSVMPIVRALSIEEGRKPGEIVPYLQAVRYVTGRRYLTRRRISEGLPEADHKAARKLQEAVRVHGAKGKAFIAGAAAAINRDMPRLLNVVAKKIESGWGK